MDSVKRRIIERCKRAYEDIDRADNFSLKSGLKKQRKDNLVEKKNKSED